MNQDNRTDSRAGRRGEEEEEVFVDAVTSPDPGEPTTLRRSARKRRSVTEVLDLENTAKTTCGKRHRPLTNNMQRTPDTGGKKTGAQGRGASPDLQPRRKEGLTVSTDPPTKQTPEQVLLLGGLRSVLREELQRSEERMGARLGGVEESISTLKDCLLYTSPSPRDRQKSRMPSSA